VRTSYVLYNMERIAWGQTFPSFTLLKGQLLHREVKQRFGAKRSLVTASRHVLAHTLS
jgi:hypothetical protein